MPKTKVRRFRERRPAVPVAPPEVPEGHPRCPCCDGPLGARSWHIAECIVCYDAEQGTRTTPIVYQAQGVRGGTYRMVRFARTHTRCPLKNCPLQATGGDDRGVIPRAA